MRRLYLLFFLCLCCALPAFAARKQIGTACSYDANSVDWDAIAQCNGTTFIKAPLALGQVTAPTYTTTTCDAAKEGMIQYISGTGVQFCNGSSWQTLGSGGGAMPTGTVAFFALSDCPSGWLLADGTNGTYDLRGEFIRALDKGRGVDNGRVLGSAQGDAIRNITGSLRTGYQGMPIGYIDSVSGAFSITETAGRWSQVYSSAAIGSTAAFDASRVVPVANENRPRNVALIACQKL